METVLQEGLGASTSEGKEMAHGLVLAFKVKVLCVKCPAVQKHC